MVFATWVSEKPQKNLDQYLIYINPDNKYIDFIEFTVRDKGGFAIGTVKFEGITNSNGIKFPKQITAYFQNRVPGKKIGYTMEVKSLVSGKKDVIDSFFIVDAQKKCEK